MQEHQSGDKCPENFFLLLKFCWSMVTGRIIAWPIVIGLLVLLSAKTLRSSLVNSGKSAQLL